ncbi:MAG TPA: hypothetical protein PKW18_12875 [Candidatus Sumerlaeota bacterium]|nr:MAG: hypothetical protein BWY12_00428 [candidate division BRC1 bacterium ADurb.Bin183]HOE64225.1 hypothetical protein [Candidatus Sumerlaeota bacterium]HRR32035.1 hypothetical protein [Candidatus Sumerlaeia bacterium]HON48968.1 hypothetical protein [Candidatus Sumerlaeota bacterium]HOR65722.1 hypothetical protein [Candidatus Sumerlaeota bacterium]
MRYKNRNRGSGLLLVLFFGLVLGTITALLLRQAVFQRRANARFSIRKEEQNASEYALNKMISEIQFLGTYKPVQVGGEINNFHNAVLGVSPPRIPGFEISEASVTCIEGDNLQYANISDTSHEWYGYPAMRIVYRLEVRARKKDSPFNEPGVKLRRDVEVLNIPLYVFGIFYDNMLEIWPGPAFSMRGRVHSNSDIWLGSGNRADYYERITSAGNIFHGRAPKSGQSGGDSPVYIFNGSELKNMRQSDGTWLDSQARNWVSRSMALWNGYVMDKAHGLKPIRLPIPSYQNPHTLIERADPVNDEPSLRDIKFEYKADLKIARDPRTNAIVASDKNGNNLLLTYPDPKNPNATKSIIKESTFYNYREGKTIRSLDLNLGNLIESGIDIGNGIIYISEEPSGTGGSQTQPAVRILNGSRVPATLTGGLSIATDDPLYVQGDFNAGANRRQVLLAGDSINILSNAWNDARQVNSASFSLQRASATETNAIFMAGNVGTGKYGTHYSGGAENYFRYLENWSGIRHTFRGSMLNLWESMTALGKWVYGGKHYEAPNRDWYWDNVLGGIAPPPGMLSFFQVNPLQWDIVP